MSTYSKYLIALFITTALPMTAPLFTDGPLTLAPNLKVRTNENGYLRVDAGTGTTDGPLTNFGNIKLRTNENGYLRVSCDTCGGGTVSDTAYGPSWDTVTDVAPSKNAVYDKIQAVLAGGGLGTTDIDTSAELKAILTDENAPDGASSKIIMALGSLSIASGKTATFSNTLTFTGTDSSSVAFGAGGTVLYSGGALGTPSSGTATNITGLPEGGLAMSDVTTNNAGTSQHGFLPKGDGNVAHCISGTIAWVSCVATTAIDTSAELATILTDENGTGKAIFSDGTLAITAAKTLTVTGSMTQSVTDGSTVAFGTGGTVLYSGGALGTPSSGTLTNATGLPAGGLTLTDTTTNNATTSAHGFLPKGDNNASNCLSGQITWVSCGSGGGGTPGGSDTYVQYNDGGSFGAESTFVYDKVTNTATIQNIKVSGATGFFISDSAANNYANIKLTSDLGSDRAVSLTMNDSAITVGLGGGGTIIYATNNLGALSSTTSAQLASVLSDETGAATGSPLAVFSVNPALTVPLLNGYRCAYTATKTTNYTVGASDCTIPVDASGSSVTITLTLPTASSAASGRVYTVIRIDADVDGAVIVDGNGAETIDGAANVSLPFGTALSIMSDGTNWRTWSSSGQYLAAPAADRVLGYDKSAESVAWMDFSGCSITGTTITCAGSGTVTNTGGNLTSNAVVLGAGTADTKVVAGIITDGTAKLILGVDSTTAGTIKFWNATSGSITLTPATGALGTVTATIPAATGTLVMNDNTATLTNKTLSTEGTGNDITTTVLYSWMAAGCQNTVATLGFNYGTSGFPGAACVGSTSINGTMDMDASTDEGVDIIVPVPTAAGEGGVLTGAVDVVVWWQANSASTNNVNFCVTTGASAIGASTDPTMDNTVCANSANGGSNLLNKLTITGIDITDWASNKLNRLHFYRNADASNDAAGTETDDLAVDARVIMVEVLQRVIK